MKIARETLGIKELEYDISKICPPEELLFIDIETTGFTARSSYLYLIGCAYYQNNSWCTIQWLAESYEQEADILKAFFEFMTGYKYLVHFNGNQFDLPFITQKCISLGLDYNFDNITGIDLYKRISPLKYFLGLPNCKQKTIEQFLGINRTDVFSGGELISVYHDYVKSPTEFSRNSLLLHNEDDIVGMIQILPILAYTDLFNDGIKAKRVAASKYTDYYGNQKQELIIYASILTKLPKPISCSANNCYFTGEDDECSLRVPIFVEEMKYFYANYKDYYYLPSEDCALHKSVANVIDKERRVQAQASNCYTRKESRYLPQWEILFEPIFRRDYKSKEVFFELTEELKRDRAGFTKYANHILSMLGTTY